jgi:hypothetical protein
VYGVDAGSALQDPQVSEVILVYIPSIYQFWSGSSLRYEVITGLEFECEYFDPFYLALIPTILRRVPSQNREPDNRKHRISTN